MSEIKNVFFKHHHYRAKSEKLKSIAGFFIHQKNVKNSIFWA